MFKESKRKEKDFTGNKWLWEPWWIEGLSELTQAAGRKRTISQDPVMWKQLCVWCIPWRVGTSVWWQECFTITCEHKPVVLILDYDLPTGIGQMRMKYGGASWVLHFSLTTLWSLASSSSICLLVFSHIHGEWKKKKNFPHYGMVSKIKLSDAYRKIQTTPGS